MLSASVGVGGSWSGAMLRVVRMCVARSRYGTSRMSSKSFRAKLCSRDPLRIWLSVRPFDVLMSWMMEVG